MDTTPRPTGTVTFLFTDIEGSTQLWEQHPDAMRLALARHDACLHAAIESNQGYVFKTVGDAFCAAFATAANALDAALDAQRNLRALHPSAVATAASLSLKVRIALHTGAAEARGGDYFGPALNRIARLLAIGHGGQVLLSQTTADLVQEELPPEASLRPLGSHRLRDLQRPEQVYQLLHPDLPADFPPLRSLDALPNNLSRQLTRFIGREHEIAEVKRLLSTSALLTLTGAGGCGKTRLALQVAADLLEEYADGVWLVELAALSDPSLVPQTVASALGLRETVGRPLTETLVNFLRTKEVLLLLDNCEHLLTACAQLTETLFRACPHLRILASSREALGLMGEQSYRVPSLSLPEPKRLPPLERLQEFEAVQLFTDRAVLSQATFTVTAANAAAVVQVCQRLDGIPLAIELAAARVKSLPVEKLNERLDDMLRLLTGGSRTALPRQQTLRALVDWSYDLLSEPERTLLRRLSVFAGGWALEAAEAVCAGEEVDDWQVLDLLTGLVEKSLVQYEEGRGEGRYRLLETVRQYAWDRLLDASEVIATQGRHLDWCLRRVEQAEPQWFGPEQVAWLERLEADHDNVRSALVRAAENAPDKVLRLAAALGPFWDARGYRVEGLRALEGALRQTDPRGAGEPWLLASRMKGLARATQLAHKLGEFDRARSLSEELLALSEEQGDSVGRAAALFGLGSIAGVQGNEEQAQALLKEALVLQRQLGSTHAAAITLNALGLNSGHMPEAQEYHEESLHLHRRNGNRWGQATALTNLSSLAIREGSPETARRLAEEGMALYQEVGDQGGVALCYRHLGTIAWHRGQSQTARLRFQESLSISGRLREKAMIARCLEALAGVAGDQGEPERAARLFGAAAALRTAIGVPLPASAQADHEVRLAALRKGIGAQMFARAWAEGQELELEQAIAAAMEEGATG